jgi:hypothetical protein
MKKILGFSLVLIAASTIFVACKKDYTCTCTTKDSSGTIADYTVSTTIHSTKSKATDACTALKATAGTLSTTCAIK